MTKEEYQANLMACAHAAVMLSTMDLEMMLEAIAKAETAAPIIDPTLFRQKAAAMQQDKEMLEAAVPLAKIGKKLMDHTTGRPRR